jgi:hypothetical protein
MSWLKGEDAVVAIGRLLVGKRETETHATKDEEIGVVHMGADERERVG